MGQSTKEVFTIVTTNRNKVAEGTTVFYAENAAELERTAVVGASPGSSGSRPGQRVPRVSAALIRKEITCTLSITATEEPTRPLQLRCTQACCPQIAATKAELEALPWFDKVSADQRVSCFWWAGMNRKPRIRAGEDRKRHYSGHYQRILCIGGDPDSLYFVDTLPAVNVLMRIGYLSRRLHLVLARQAPSRPWSSAGLPKLVRIVQRPSTNSLKLRGHAIRGEKGKGLYISN